MSETQEEREARWAAARARQEAYRNSPEAKARRAERIANDLCFLEGDQCVTHGVPDSLAHHFAMNPDAYND